MRWRCEPTADETGYFYVAAFLAEIEPDYESISILLRRSNGWCWRFGANGRR